MSLDDLIQEVIHPRLKVDEVKDSFQEVQVTEMCPVETVIHVIGRILTVKRDMLDNVIKVSLQIFAERV